MDIQLADERLLLLEERLTADEVEQKALDRRASAFGSGIGSFLQRPKPEDITLVGRQRRLVPFWHVAARAVYVYERSRDYTVPGSSQEVTAVTIDGQRRELDQALGGQRAFRVSALEHCRNEFRHESFVDGTSGGAVAEGAALITGPLSEIGDPASLSAEETVVVPPEQRASFVVRQALTEVMRPVQADRILEEAIALERTDLYYRPVWAFEFIWQGRDKRAVVEVDSITGQAATGKPLLGQIKGMLNRDVLFDVGGDTLGLLIPGGSIAVRLVQAAVDKK
ncbi:MAG TPA: hypothetical protein VMM78_02510 [Thermomicrobiales bacterium]|nr:hypothetical protein [Thermomicrobiales bacterium]